MINALERSHTAAIKQLNLDFKLEKDLAVKTATEKLKDELNKLKDAKRKQSTYVQKGGEKANATVTKLTKQLKDLTTENEILTEKLAKLEEDLAGANALSVSKKLPNRQEGEER